MCIDVGWREEKKEKKKGNISIPCVVVIRLENFESFGEVEVRIVRTTGYCDLSCTFVCIYNLRDRAAHVTTSSSAWIVSKVLVTRRDEPKFRTNTYVHRIHIYIYTHIYMYVDSTTLLELFLFLSCFLFVLVSKCKCGPIVMSNPTIKDQERKKTDV